VALNSFRRRSTRGIAVARCCAVATLLALILLVSLTPVPGSARTAFSVCVLCGERALADAGRNLLLYLPLGVALGWDRRRVAPVVGLCVLLSAGVEVAQTFLPGRDPGLSDIVFNGAGALLGAFIGTRRLSWAYPATRTARRLAAGALIAFTGVLVSTALLLAPISDTAVVTAGLHGRSLLHASSRAGAVGLDEPTYILPGSYSTYAPSQAPPVRERSFWWVGIPDHQPVSVGPTPGLGWAMLGYPDSLAARLIPWLNALWLMLLLTPTGYWATRGEVALATAAGAAMILAGVPPLMGTLQAHPHEWAGAALGLASGSVLQTAIGGRRRRAEIS
jgi:glycopeptide antibiotics resistance protein